MNRGRRVVGLIAPILLVILLSAPVALARSSQERGLIAAFQADGDATIVVCHAYRSVATPYSLRLVPNDGTYGGHLAHLDTPLDPANLSWPDIIPAPRDENGESFCPVSPPAAPDDPADPATGSITVHKIDQNGDPVAGACFNLGLANDFMAAQRGANCTDESGHLVIGGLTVPGTYQLAEESTAPGCVVNGELPAVTLTAAQPDQDVTVINRCERGEPTATIAPTLPATSPATSPATAPATVTASATRAPSPPATASATVQVTPGGPGKTPAATVTALPTTGAGQGRHGGWLGWLIIAAALALLGGAMATHRARR